MKRAIRIVVCLVVLLPLGLRAGDLSVDNATVTSDMVVFERLFVHGENAIPTPVLYYSFNAAPASNAVVDESLHGNDGTAYSIAWTNEGQNGGAFYFANGVGHYVNVSCGASLDLAGPYAIAAWIKPEQPTGDAGGPGIVMRAGQSTIRYGLGWSGGEVVLCSSGADSLTSMWTTGQQCPTGQWRHVVGVVEGTNANQAKIYINGQVVKTGTMRYPYNIAAYPLYVGRWRDQYYYRGMIDEVFIFDCALTATQVGTLFSNTAVSVMGTNSVLVATPDSVVIRKPTTIQRLVRQGDIEMGVFTNSP